MDTVSINCVELLLLLTVHITSVDSTVCRLNASLPYTNGSYGHPGVGVPINLLESGIYVRDQYGGRSPNSARYGRTKRVRRPVVYNFYCREQWKEKNLIIDYYYYNCSCRHRARVITVDYSVRCVPDRGTTRADGHESVL